MEDTDGEPEPDDEINGPATVVEFVAAKRVGRVSRVAKALALAMLLVMVPLVNGHAAQGAIGRS